MEMEVICFTTSEGEWRSMRRLWMRISQRSNVLVPSPQGDFLTHRRRVRVGRRTGPATWSSFSFATCDEVPAHLLERLHVAARQRDADAVQPLFLRLEGLHLRLHGLAWL
ncbi:unnamed protein product [Prorocentrum cordatum]|uniref:Uncharacterized protein n=1 Tax=Prorocentrum cordatum TaxID=2364126 RepID=A0ABN9Q0F8_9DINO|nr:unnamed protein product [Polarella glacialis]